MFKHILFFSFMLLLDSMLILVSLEPNNSAIWWSVIGLSTYILICLFVVIKDSTTDFGNDASSGQLFIISLVIGPLFTALIMLVVIKDFIPKRK